VPLPAQSRLRRFMLYAADSCFTLHHDSCTMIRTSRCSLHTALVVTLHTPFANSYLTHSYREIHHVHFTPDVGRSNTFEIRSRPEYYPVKLSYERSFFLAVRLLWCLLTSSSMRFCFVKKRSTPAFASLACSMKYRDLCAFACKQIHYDTNLCKYTCN